MADYDDIAVPVKGQPISSGTFGTRVRDAIIDLGVRMGIREAAEELPAPWSAAGGNGNSVTAAINTWQTLSPNGVSLVVTNPSAVFDLVCMVYFGAWMQIATAGSVRFGLNITGGITSDPDPGPNSPVGFGLMPLTSSNASDQHMGCFQMTIPAGAAAVTLTGQGFRSIANAASVNYPAINVVPMQFRAP